MLQGFCPILFVSAFLCGHVQDLKFGLFIQSTTWIFLLSLIITVKYGCLHYAFCVFFLFAHNGEMSEAATNVVYPIVLLTTDGGQANSIRWLDQQQGVVGPTT